MILTDLLDGESVFLDANILVMQLSKFQQSIAEVPRLAIRILIIPDTLVEAAALLSRQTGLLSDDALILAIMPAKVGQLCQVGFDDPLTVEQGHA